MKNETKGKIISVFMSLALLVAMMTIGNLVFSSRTFAADVTYSVLNSQTKTCADMGDGTCADVTSERTQFFAVMGASGLTADTFYMLVDLSDTANFPHTETSNVVITACDAEIVGTAVQWRVAIGAVTDITANTTTVKFLKALTANPVTHEARQAFTLPASGLDTANLAAADTELTAFTTGTDLAGPAGTANAAVGDIIVWVDELSGTASATFGAGVVYWTK